LVLFKASLVIPHKFKQQIHSSAPVSFRQLMDTFGVNHSIEYWIDYLREFLNDILLRIDLQELDRLVTKIFYNSDTHYCASRILSHTKIAWNCWIRRFRLKYPELFQFLEDKGFFQAGVNFLSIASQHENITRTILLTVVRRNQITNTFGILELALEISISILSRDFSDSAGFSSTFQKNPVIKRTALDLIYRIDPSSRIFNNRIATE